MEEQNSDSNNQSQNPIHSQIADRQDKALDAAPPPALETRAEQLALEMISDLASLLPENAMYGKVKEIRLALQRRIGYELGNLEASDIDTPGRETKINKMPKPKKGYCWKCAEQFPMSELVEDDDPYIKDEDDPNDKNYQCRECEAKDDE